jgi:exo-beta-1,3-glucanase (GH17 family)/cellulose synthase/poly-beta-1,6-N-acetylglucosamine synthase-like glycosyltransferase
MKRSNFLICVFGAILFVSCWALFNRPEVEPPWPERIQGFSFQPMRPGNDPVRHILPTEEEIEQDLQLLSGTTNAVRTYSVEGVLAKIPQLARRHGLNVTLGIWLDGNLESNEEQIATGIRVARSNYRNVIRVIVGNEVLYRQELTKAQLEAYMDRVRAALDVPVSTAEPWHIWFKNQDLIEHADFVAIHLLPYWEGIPLDHANYHVVEHYDLIAKTFPEKEIVIGEVGWPSNGRIRQGAVASLANEAIFLRRFLQQAEERSYVYYVMEAFDQTWKRQGEGAVGAYWGVYNAEREPKFPFTKPIVGVPEWQMLAAISISFAAIIFMLLLTDSKILPARGRGFLAIIAYMSATGIVWIVYIYSRRYLNASDITVGVVLVVGLIGVLLVILAEAHEWAEAMWGVQHRHAVPIFGEIDEQAPFVSIHIPTYNEPPEMMKETLLALLALDYPRFEVIVMDNNTKDPNVWRPVAEFCEQLGERFHFFHEDKLAGYKAGALNYALRKTAEEAEIIAVIDSDYKVSQNWLRDLAMQFRQPNIAIVQAPQDYRDDRDSLFKAMCYAEYRGFFRIGMVIRNERNAIIQHGTMTMVRRSVLEEVGNWAEWCITEDAELGLRIFEHGYEALYVPQSYGRGLMPDTFVDFKKQRFRWAYGAVQIMRRHRKALLQRNRDGLTKGQQYHFVAGWLPWLADSVNLIFTLAALYWSAGMLNFPTRFDPPMFVLSMVPIIFFAFKVLKMFNLYRHRVNASLGQSIASAIAGLSLTHTIAKAMVYGFITKNLPFFRTPKQVAEKRLWYAMQTAREEGLMALALLLAAYLLFRYSTARGPDLSLWIAVLLVLSVPYLASICMSFIAAFPKLPARWIKEKSIPIQRQSNAAKSAPPKPPALDGKIMEESKL